MRAHFLCQLEWTAKDAKIAGKILFSWCSVRVLSGQYFSQLTK